MPSDQEKELRFGTSGLRDVVENLTDREIYINTMGFIGFLRETGEVTEGNRIAVGGDLRSSTPRISRAVIQAVRDCRCEADYCGSVPSPALAYYAMQRGMPSVMVTGSHIPEDRNGVKFTKQAGEVLKSDEADILRNVAEARCQQSSVPAEDSLFGEEASFKQSPPLPEPHAIATDDYIRRYLDVFPSDCLAGKTVAAYQHSAVGRDIFVRVFEKLGATVIAPTQQISVTYTDEDTDAQITESVALRSASFVPVDTEKVNSKTRAVLSYLAETHNPDFIVSADGDTDRPLLADEAGQFLPGDKLGLLALKYLMQRRESAFAALPVSTNDGVVSALQSANVQITLTKIGSPYIIAAMLAAEDEAVKVGWEANGGFLLGEELDIHGKVLSPLPTRDAVLPLLATMLLAKQQGKSASQLFADELEPRYNVAAVTDHKTPGAEEYTPEVGKAIIALFSPTEPDIQQVDFEDGVAWISSSGGQRASVDTTSALAREIDSIQSRLSQYFQPVGLHTPMSVNYVDGIRVTFAEGNVVYHMRPSGNAPEFRNYVTANTAEEAERIVQGRKLVIPAIVQDVIAGRA